MKKLLSTLLLVGSTIGTSALSAEVNCQFMSQITLSKEGEWVSAETDIMKLISLFGPGFTMPIENASLALLDTKQPFLAGETPLGKVYLMGSDMGVQGKLTKVENDLIKYYEGFCTIGFG